MLSNVFSFFTLMIVFGIGGFAIVAAPQVQPNHEGLAKCQELHPVRYCRIANGFPVEPLPN